MALISPTLASSIARHHGIVTTDELIRDGLTHRAVAHHVRLGALVRLHNGVFRVATAPDTFEARCAAACAADPEAVVTGSAAARLWEFRHIGRPDVPIVLVPHDRTPITRGVLLRRTNVLDDEDRVARDDGICVASPVRAGGTAPETSVTSASSASPSGCSTITRRCRHCGVSSAG
jgi:hypothetical protein